MGVVRSYGNPEDDSSEQCSIEVEFHDTTFHNSMMMQNYQGYTMGVVSTTVLAVANARWGELTLEKKTHFFGFL